MSNFKEYAAAFHAQNDDILHFGVKGMKWHHHKLRGRPQPLDPDSAKRFHDEYEKTKENYGNPLSDEQTKETMKENAKINNLVREQRSKMDKMDDRSLANLMSRMNGRFSDLSNTATQFSNAGNKKAYNKAMDESWASYVKYLAAKKELSLRQKKRERK